MALEGKLQADFESFYTAVDTATVKFLKFEEDGAKVERRLNSVANSFTGRKVIQEATLVAEAIEQIGGVSKLSTAEATRSLTTLEQAMDKMLRTGEMIPVSMTRTAAELRNVVRATDEADKTVARISENYRKFDGILQSLGVNIGPYVKGLEDVTAIASGGVGSLGLFGGAAAVVATAIGAWKFGEKVGEVSGLTDAIAKGTAALMGWGDVAQETALAQADAIDLMGKAEENQKRVTKAAEEHAKATKEESDALKENWRITEGNKDAMARLAEQLDAVREKKKADAIAAFQASQAQSIFGDETEKTTVKIEAQTAALEAKEDQLKKVADAEAERQKKTAEFMNAPTLNDRQAQSVSTDLAPLTGTALDEAIRLGTRAGDVQSGAGPGVALNRLLAELEAKEGRYQIKNNQDFFAMQHDQVLLAQLRQLQASGQIPGFAGGVENYPGGWAMVGEQGPELVRLPGGSSVKPNSQIGGGVTVNITVAAGLGDRYSIAKAIKDVLVEEYASMGYRGPVAFGTTG